jgi:5'-nucleotidase
MSVRSTWFVGVLGMVTALSWQATAQAQPHPGVLHSHSNESDVEDERLSNHEARRRAAERIAWRDEKHLRDPLLRIKLLGINDFHGQLAAGRLVGPRPVGGAAVLASYLKTAAAQAKDGHLLIHAGDHVGASPPDSALLQDEPSISFLNQLANRHCDYVDVARGPWHLSYLQPRCNVIGTLGNHEFDEGVTEMLRLIDGGRHANGPFLEKRWKGARFPYISSNVVSRQTGEPLLSPFTVRWFEGVPVGVIGAVLKETPSIVTPTGVAGVQFLDEAEAINQYTAVLKRFGVKTIVVTIHQGIRQTSYEGQTDPAVQGLSGPIVDIVKKLSSDVDVVVSGHAHGFTNAFINNAAGHPILVTQAFSASTAYGDIDLTISRKTRDVVEKSAAVVTTWADQGPGLTPDASAAALAASAAKAVGPLVNRLVGVAQGDITVTENAAGESAMGNLIADAQRVQTSAQFAFMNPGGIRNGLLSGEVTWGELFTVQPFGNDLVSMDLTGAQIRRLLEQQWQGQTAPRILKTSGLTYTWDAARAVGDRVVEIRDAGGQLLGDSQAYRVTVNSFMASGGDNFFVLTEGTNRVVGPVDLDALVEYIEALPQPFTAAPEGRIIRLN